MGLKEMILRLDGWIWEFFTIIIGENMQMKGNYVISILSLWRMLKLVIYTESSSPEEFGFIKI